MNWQTVIPVGSKNELTFDSFEGEHNQALLVAVRDMIHGERPGRGMFIWGASGSGKTHLLHASCVEAQQLGRPFRYLVCVRNMEWEDQCSLVRDISSGVLVCVDDLHSTSPDEVMEWKWLSLYEMVCQAGGNLVVTASRPPGELELVTPDLVSRLAAGGVFHLQPLGDAGKRRVLRRRSRARGFDISESVIDYIMRHHVRDTSSLCSLLDRIDSASLSQQRRITVPFIRDLLVDQK